MASSGLFSSLGNVRQQRGLSLTNIYAPGPFWCMQEDAQSGVLTGGVALEGALGDESSGGTQKAGKQQEGMGQTYKAFAILPASKPAPVPFS